MSYTVSADSVITSVFAPSGGTFLTCGGTNIAPKVGTTWANFSVGSSNFKYIFNSNKFNNGMIYLPRKFTLTFLAFSLLARH